MGAQCLHHWSLCGEDEGAVCIDVSKGFWAWDEYGDGPEEIAAAMLACRSGYFMVGDEWELQDALYCDDYPEWCWPMSRQVSEARWYIEKRAEINPDCRLAFGGILTFHPYAGGVIAADWVPEFYNAYVAEYGEAPDIEAMVFDDYYWPESWYRYSDREIETWEDVTLLSINAVYDTYGPIQVWAREVGSLWMYSEEWALAAMEQLDTVTRHYDRYFWFITRDGSGYWNHCALWIDGELTDLGRQYVWR